jgi:hypothetical protein
MPTPLRSVFQGAASGFPLWAAIILLCGHASRCEPPLLVCIPGGQAPGRIESALGTAVSPRPVISFQRIKDLDEIISSYPGSPLIGSAAYIRYLPGYTILLRGKKGGMKLKKYLIISGNQGSKPINADTYKVGVLDFLGRDKLPDFVREAFGTSFAKMKRVSKKEDLQSLLGMEIVDAAIIEESDLAEMQAGTKVKLYVVMESKPMDSFPALACPVGAECAGLRKTLSIQPKAVLHTLGIEGWE